MALECRNISKLPRTDPGAVRHRRYVLLEHSHWRTRASSAQCWRLVLACSLQRLNRPQSVRKASGMPMSQFLYATYSITEKSGYWFTAGFVADFEAKLVTYNWDKRYQPVLLRSAISALLQLLRDPPWKHFRTAAVCEKYSEAPD